MRADITNLLALFVNDVPLMDTRAPIEFARGSFPGAMNLPLMTDSERQQIGTCYKQRGQDAAIALGHRLVSGKTKSARISAWAHFAQTHPNGVLYCFRGGLRSQIVQQWLKTEAGITYPRVVGGYKAMRNALIESTRQAIAQCQFLIIGGLTGTGKTEILARVNNSLDLEGYANHRGSSFGKRVSTQPAQIDFEHRLAIDLLKKQSVGIERFVIEDEGLHIGSCSLPVELYQLLQQAPIVWLEDDFEHRVERILNDYVIKQCSDFLGAYGPQAGFEHFAAQLVQSLNKIAKRLGGERHQRLLSIMQAALAAQANHGSTALHRVWISALLSEYYDPMYAHQRSSKADRIIFTGNRQAVAEFLNTQPPS